MDPSARGSVRMPGSTKRTARDGSGNVTQSQANTANDETKSANVNPIRADDDDDTASCSDAPPSERAVSAPSDVEAARHASEPAANFWGFWWESARRLARKVAVVFCAISWHAFVTGFVVACVSASRRLASLGYALGVLALALALAPRVSKLVVGRFVLEMLAEMNGWAWILFVALSREAHGEHAPAPIAAAEFALVVAAVPCYVARCAR